ncbi:MAG: C40 family peptidase [Nitrospinae bacterium]|nr:C40 family peptidase [Nitrospinota bacterium]
MTRSEIVRKAREYLGTPFHHQGRAKGRGVDCVGLVVCVLRELGLEIDDCRTYPQTPDSGLLLNKLRQHLEEIPIDRAVSGDVYLMTIMGYPQHVAFVSPGAEEAPIPPSHMTPPLQRGRGGFYQRGEMPPRADAGAMSPSQAGRGLGEGRIGIIHTNRQVGRVVETGLDHAWKRRIVKAFTIAGISDE